MAYLDAAKQAAILAIIGPASLRRAMRVTILPEIAAAIAADAAAGIENMPAAAGVVEASKLAWLGADKELDEFHTAALYLGAGAGTLISATAAEINALSGLATEVALLSGLAEELAALADLDTELGLLAGLTADAATLNAVPSNPGVAAKGTLYVPTAVKSEETVTIGADVYEFDAGEGAVTEGSILVDIEASTVKAAGTLTLDTQPTAGDTMTIDTTVYTFVPDGTANAPGEVNVGADLADAQVDIQNAIAGTDGYNVVHPSVTMADFAANAAVFTAIDGGVAGNSIATTETFTAGTNVFDAASLGTTVLGEDASAANATDALIAAINASGTEAVTAYDIGTTEILIVADAVGVVALQTLETLAGAGNVWDAATMTGGAAAAAARIAKSVRVPNATEVTLGNMQFAFDFLPTMVSVMVRTTATGAQVAWDGAITIVDSGGAVDYVELDNSGGTDWAVTDTVYLVAYE